MGLHGLAKCDVWNMNIQILHRESEWSHTNIFSQMTWRMGRVQVGQQTQITTTQAEMYFSLNIMPCPCHLVNASIYFMNSIQHEETQILLKASMSVLHPLPRQWTQSACLCPQMSYSRLWWKWTHHWQLRITSKVRPDWLGQNKQSMIASQIYGVKLSSVEVEVWYYFELCSLHWFWLESFYLFMEKGICQFYDICPSWKDKKSKM